MNETTTEERNVKRCPTCEQTKPLDQFGKNRARKDGVQSRCKLCEAAKHKASFRPKKKPVPVSARSSTLIAAGKSKVCRCCGAAKRINCFYKNRTRKDGLQSYCITCMSNGNRKGYLRRIERAKVASVAGKMVSWQAAQALGLSEPAFLSLARKHGISTAFVMPRWTKESEGQILLLRMQGLTQKQIAERVGRTTLAIRLKFRELRNR